MNPSDDLKRIPLEPGEPLPDDLSEDEVMT